MKGLEKRIDEILGEQGAGKALTKEVGAYKRTFFKNSLPKMTYEQVLDLETKVDERVAQKRQELSSGLPKISWNIDQNGKIWVGKSIEMNEKLTATLQNNLKDDLKNGFAANKKSTNIDADLLISSPLLTITLVKDESKIMLSRSPENIAFSEGHENVVSGKLDGKELDDALTRFAPDPNTKRNLLTVLVRVATGFDAMLYEQENFYLRHTNNELNLTVDLKNNQFNILSISKKTVDQLTVGEPGEADAPKGFSLNKDNSATVSVITLMISEADVEQGIADSLKVKAPVIDCYVFPTLLYRPAPSHPDL